MKGAILDGLLFALCIGIRSGILFILLAIAALLWLT